MKMEFAGELARREVYPAVLFPGVDDIPPYNKSQSAQYNQEHGNGIYPWVGEIIAKAVVPKDIYSRVTESGNRVEDGVPASAKYTIFGNKDKTVADSSNSFDHKSSKKYFSQKLYQTVQGVHV